MKLKFYLLLFTFFCCGQIKIIAQSVVITDQNSNTGTINIDCSYSFVPPKKVRLTATYPDLKSSTDYTVATAPFASIGNFTQGTPVVFVADDSWSSNIPITFPFCFYGNQFTTLNVTDNGIVRFGYNSATAEAAPQTVSNTTPSSGLTKNAIFGGFQDMLNIPVAFGCSVGENCGTITTFVTGVAPFRKFIVNYNGVNHFNCDGFNTKKSTFQIVLSETTNEIDINVLDKPFTCSANGTPNSLLGLNNSDGSIGIAPPNRNTGYWDAQNESYKFTPSGTSATTIQWFDSLSNLIGTGNPIDVIPTSNTSYSVEVNYNTCVPQMITDDINIVFDLNYPVTPDINQNICDVVAPFFSQIVDVESFVPTIPGRVTTFYTLEAEANAAVNAIPNMNAVLISSQSQVFYYRVTQGICYSVGKITINLFKTPTTIDQDVFVCDSNNDNSETVTLSTLTSQLIGLDPAFAVIYYQNLPNAISGSNPFNSAVVTTIPGFYEVYIRTVNPLIPIVIALVK
jgi:large repetitive protein